MLPIINHSVFWRSTIDFDIFYFFDEEVDKLEKWSEDVRNSIKYEIKELDKEIQNNFLDMKSLFDYNNFENVI